MNYIRQINAFWEMQAYKPVNAAETRLYFAILNFANRAGWREVLRLPNSALIGAGAANDRHSLNRMRSHLAKLGYITYAPSKSINECGVYTVTVMYDEEGFLNPELFTDDDSEVIPTENFDGEEESEIDDISEEYNSGENTAIQEHYGVEDCCAYTAEEENACENTAVREAHGADKSVYAGTKRAAESKKRKYFDDVYLTDEEYGKLTDEYGADTEGILELLNNYKCSSGKSYKSDYFAVRSWAGDRYLERKRTKPAGDFGTGELYAPSPNVDLLDRVMIEKWNT